MCIRDRRWSLAEPCLRHRRPVSLRIVLATCSTGARALRHLQLEVGKWAAEPAGHGLLAVSGRYRFAVRSNVKA
eukprot:5946532-Alexandrium_andersonii.AAC.1